jgi:hypothetical protein
LKVKIKEIQMQRTVITRKTHPELYEPGIIFTNAPYRTFFYHVEKVASKERKLNWHTNKNCSMLEALSHGGITVEVK